jgi:cell division protein FtsW
MTKLATTVLVICVLGLLALGLVMVYSVTPLQESTRFVARQLIAGAIGLTVAGVLAVRLNYRDLKRVSKVLFVLAVVMLLAVLAPGLGHRANGARRWFRFGALQFQPSDFAKLALLIALAHYGEYWQRQMGSFKLGVLVPAGLVGTVTGLIFLEPDWGTALLLGAVSVVILLVAGVRWRYVLGPVALGGLAVGVLLYFNPERSDRIYSWLHLEETKDATGYQVFQAQVALGTGGQTGTGLNTSTQKLFVPEHRTDFLLAIVGEEFGYAGSLAVIAAFVSVFVCGLVIAGRAADRFGLLLGTGISFLIGLQAFINIGVVSGALPNKGLALPFVSYGGTNLIAMLLCAGVLLSIARGSAEADPAKLAPLGTPEMPLARLA